MKRMMVAMAVVVMSFTAVHAQIPQSQLKTDSDEQLLREWVKVLASDEFGGNWKKWVWSLPLTGVGFSRSI